MSKEDACHYCGNNIIADDNQEFVVAVYRDELYSYCNPNCLALHFCEISKEAADRKDGE